MANTKGGRAARKRDRQNAKARARNASCKAKLHDAHKKLFKAATDHSGGCSLCFVYGMFVNKQIGVG